MKTLLIATDYLPCLMTNKLRHDCSAPYCPPPTTPFDSKNLLKSAASSQASWTAATCPLCPGQNACGQNERKPQPCALLRLPPSYVRPRSSRASNNSLLLHKTLDKAQARTMSSTALLLLHSQKAANVPSQPVPPRLILKAHPPHAHAHAHPYARKLLEKTPHHHPQQATWPRPPSRPRRAMST